jgi:hypothetical protein
MANQVKQKRHVTAEKWKHPKTPIALNDCEGQSTDRVLTWRHSTTAKSDRSRSPSSENERLIMNILFSLIRPLRCTHSFRKKRDGQPKRRKNAVDATCFSRASLHFGRAPAAMRAHPPAHSRLFFPLLVTNKREPIFFISKHFYLPQATASTFKKLIIPRISLRIIRPCTSIDSAFEALS